MKRLKLLILLIIPITVNAQNFSIHNAENFKNGDVFTFQKCEPENVNPQKSGKNVIWDFTGLEEKKNDTLIEKIVLSKETKSQKLFPNADLKNILTDVLSILLSLKTKANLSVLPILKVE